MIKRILAITLSIAMLISVPAFAASTTDSVNGKTIRVDDFEGKTLTTYKNGYPTADVTSDVFSINSTHTAYAQGTIESAVGRDGNTSNVFKSYQQSTGFAMVIATFKGQETTQVQQISYDIKFSELAEAWLMPRSYTGAKNPLFTFDASGNVKNDGKSND